MAIYVLRNSTAHPQYPASSVCWFQTTADGQTLIDQGLATVLSSAAAAVSTVNLIAGQTINLFFSNGHRDFLRVHDPYDPHVQRRIAALANGQNLG